MFCNHSDKNALIRIHDVFLLSVDTCNTRVPSCTIKNLSDKKKHGSFARNTDITFLALTPLSRGVLNLLDKNTSISSRRDSSTPVVPQLPFRSAPSTAATPPSTTTLSLRSSTALSSSFFQMQGASVPDRVFAINLIRLRDSCSLFRSRYRTEVPTQENLVCCEEGKGTKHYVFKKTCVFVGSGKICVTGATSSRCLQ